MTSSTDATDRSEPNPQAEGFENPVLQPPPEEKNEIAYNVPYKIYGSGVVDRAIGELEPGRVLRLHHKGPDGKYVTDHRPSEGSETGFEYRRENATRAGTLSVTEGEIGYGFANAVYYEFITDSESLFNQPSTEKSGDSNAE